MCHYRRFQKAVEGASATLKAERTRTQLETKMVKIGGKKISIYFVLYDITKLKRERF